MTEDQWIKYPTSPRKRETVNRRTLNPSVKNREAGRQKYAVEATVEAEAAAQAPLPPLPRLTMNASSPERVVAMSSAK